MSISRLLRLIEERKTALSLCLDIDYKSIPEEIMCSCMQEKGVTLECITNAMCSYGKAIIDAVVGMIPAFLIKPHFYEIFGVPGISAMNDTIKYAQAKGFYVVLDIRISDTVEGAGKYAKTYLTGVEIGGQTFRGFAPDAITISVCSNFNFLQQYIFAVNAGGSEVFMFLGEECLKKLPELRSYAMQALGAYGYSNIGLMLGSCNAELAGEIRRSLGECFIIADRCEEMADVRPYFNPDGRGALLCYSANKLFANSKDMAKTMKRKIDNTHKKIYRKSRVISI